MSEDSANTGSDAKLLDKKLRELKEKNPQEYLILLEKLNEYLSKAGQGIRNAKK